MWNKKFISIYERYKINNNDNINNDNIIIYFIIYIYCLSDWFKDNCKAEQEYFDFKKVPYYCPNSDT